MFGCLSESHATGTNATTTGRINEDVGGKPDKAQACGICATSPQWPCNSLTVGRGAAQSLMTGAQCLNPIGRRAGSTVFGELRHVPRLMSNTRAEVGRRARYNSWVGSGHAPSKKTTPSTAQEDAPKLPSGGVHRMHSSSQTQAVESSSTTRRVAWQVLW